jgi:DNA adenine methylase
MQMCNWRFVHQDFQVALEAATPHDHIYCDPPYIGRHVDYFNSWDEAQEKLLFETLKNSPSRFVLSTWYNNQHRENPYIHSLWDRFYILTREHFYHVGAREINRKPMLEALVLSYKPTYMKLHLPKQNGYQLRLFEPQNEYQLSGT